MKKMKEKYKHQDEEERQLRMDILAVSSPVRNTLHETSVKKQLFILYVLIKTLFFARHDLHL